MPTCLVIQHLAPEGPYLIAEALENAGIAVELCQVFAGGQLPASLDGYSGLVVMGGPMSAASDDGFATRTAEIELLEDALERGLPALGVCLGAQLLALAAGGKVYPGAEGPEIGWAPVSLKTWEAERDVLFGELPGELTVLHWHGDTFDLPPGATHLAKSKAYPNQAFRAGPGRGGSSSTWKSTVVRSTCSWRRLAAKQQVAAWHPKTLLRRQARPSLRSRRRAAGCSTALQPLSGTRELYVHFSNRLTVC